MAMILKGHNVEILRYYWFTYCDIIRLHIVFFVSLDTQLDPLWIQYLTKEWQHVSRMVRQEVEKPMLVN